MATPVNTRFARVIANGMTQVLKPLGFAKRGAVYRRKVDGLLWLVDVQRSQWNSQERISFTINWGVFVPGLFSVYGNRADTGEPRVPQCCVHGRIGALMPGGTDRWWDLRCDDAAPAVDERVAAELRQGLVEYVLPFMQQFNGLEDVVRFLEHAEVQPVRFDPRAAAIRLAYLGIIYQLRGDRELGCEILGAAVEAAIKSPAEFREYLAALRARLCEH